tara:strand:+ start:601 stop:1068 length:468 start_codon:yes stop_codon:yes gene_type:complete
MQNFTKSQTRLAFIQFIFQSEFLNLEKNNNIDEFQNYFYNSNIATIGNKKEFKIKFNKNFFKKLCENYFNHFDKKNTVDQINKFIDLDRKFERWNIVLKSLIFAIISELQNSEDKYIKIILNDYINISKSLVNLKEIKLMNAIVQKYLNEKKNTK